MEPGSWGFVPLLRESVQQGTSLAEKMWIWATVEFYPGKWSRILNNSSYNIHSNSATFVSFQTTLRQYRNEWSQGKEMLVPGARWRHARWQWVWRPGEPGVKETLREVLLWAAASSVYDVKEPPGALTLSSLPYIIELECLCIYYYFTGKKPISLIHGLKEMVFVHAVLHFDYLHRANLSLPNTLYLSSPQIP